MAPCEYENLLVGNVGRCSLATVAALFRITIIGLLAGQAELAGLRFFFVALSALRKRTLFFSSLWRADKVPGTPCGTLRRQGFLRVRTWSGSHSLALFVLRAVGARKGQLELW